MTSCALALALMLDMSGSLTQGDWIREVEGHAKAFESEAVYGSIIREGGIAVRAVAFSDHSVELVGWTMIRTAAEARTFAAQLRQAGSGQAPVGGTLTVAALEDAERSLDEAPCMAERQVIDLVTDGVANDSRRMDAVRTRLNEAGVQLNALFVETERGREDSQKAGWEDGLSWLRSVVTEGGSALAAEGWHDFERAIRNKIVLEIARFDLYSDEPSWPVRFEREYL
jgi:hypothetical protein